MLTDYVSTSNNHHIAIFEDADGNLQEHVVSLYEATARKTQNMPVVDREYNKELGWKFLFTMKQNVFSVNGEMRTRNTTKVTGKGQVYFINKFLGDN